MFVRQDCLCPLLPQGSALAWFKPYIYQQAKGGYGEPFLTGYLEFVNKLLDNYGPTNATSAIENSLRKLVMKDGQPIRFYIVEFNRLTTQLDFGLNTFCSQFYTGLAPRIKDEIATTPGGKPATLKKLCVLAQNIDTCYWEHKEERKYEAHASTVRSDNNRSNHSGNNNSHQSSANPPPSNNQGPKNNKKTSGSGPPNGGSGGGGSTLQGHKPDLSSKLTKDGKLTPEERQQRVSTNLCLFCGNTRHVARNCCKAAAATKAHHATAESPGQSGN